jgi:hypothetical protein
VEENYRGDYEEMVRVATALSLVSIATTGGKENVTNTNMMNSAASAAGTNDLILKMRKRATCNEFDWSGDVSLGLEKLAGKVSVGLAMRKKLYTSIMENMHEMNSGLVIIAYYD